MIVTKGMYDKEFKFENNGKEESIIIKPLPTKHLPKLFGIVKLLNTKELKSLQVSVEDTDDVKRHKQEEASEILMGILSDQQTLLDVIEVVDATVQKAYPEMDSVVRDDFVARNMFNILPFIFEVNFKKA